MTHCAGYGDISGKLEVGHVLHTLMEEHKLIINFLDKLHSSVEEIKNLNDFEGIKKILPAIQDVSSHLLAAEKHHQREEDVLFPAIEDHGIEGPPAVMRQEHDELRKAKKHLHKIATATQPPSDLQVYKNDLSQVSNFLVHFLKDHIHKENNVLYPMAFEAIEDHDTWDEMKKKCDAIGYCCFTPQQV